MAVDFCNCDSMVMSHTLNTDDIVAKKVGGFVAGGEFILMFAISSHGNPAQSSECGWVGDVCRRHPFKNICHQ